MTKSLDRKGSEKVSYRPTNGGKSAHTRTRTHTHAHAYTHTQQ